MRLSSSSVDMSTSAKCGTRSPVRALRMMVSASGSSESSGVKGLVRPVAVAPGRKTIGPETGEKPSDWFNRSGTFW